MTNNNCMNATASQWISTSPRDMKLRLLVNWHHHLLFRQDQALMEKPHFLKLSFHINNWLFSNISL